MKQQGWPVILGAMLLSGGASVAVADNHGQDPHAGHGGHAEAAPDAAVFDEADVLAGFSYAMGYSLARRVLADVPDLELKEFEAGLEDAYVQNPARYNEEQMQALIEQYNGLRVARAQQALQQQAAANKAAAATFLAGNAKKRGIKTTASGLQYQVLTKGKGASPAATDTVTVHYHGTLPDGTVFDSSRERGQPEQVPLDRVIRGWTEGVQLMKTGAQYRFFIPSELAYGERGAGEAIGPNQLLIFDIELIDIQAATPLAPVND